MSKKSRYLLIIVGFLTFLTLSPLLILYVGGYAYDVSNSRLVKTGIIALRTEPEEAEVWLDGKIIANSARDIKFLLPKEYSVELRRAGYHSWKKRLAVNAGQVTWAGPVGRKIVLLRDPPAAETVSTGVADYAWLPDGRLLYLSPGSAVLADPKNPEKSEVWPLPEPLDTIAAASPGGRLLVLERRGQEGTASAVLLDTENKSFSSLPETASQRRWLPKDNGDLLMLENDRLVIFRQKQAPATVAEGVIAATLLGDDLYLLKSDGLSSSLLVSVGAAGESQALLEQQPLFRQAELFATFEKKLFLLGDGTLYQIGASLLPVAANAKAWDFNQANSTLTFFHEGQLDYFSPAENSLRMATRRGQSLSFPFVRTDLGYAFFSEDGKIKALELDSRDRQNEYLLYSAPTGITKMSLDREGRRLAVLQDGQLKQMTIR